MTTPMIPRETINTLRDFVDVVLDAIGMDCTLYLPTDVTYNAAERLDVFAKPSDYSYHSYSAKVHVHWNPSLYKLKKLGLFVEDQLPILVWFGNKATVIDDGGAHAAGEVVDIDNCLRGYFGITPEFIPANYVGVEEFEIVNIASKGMQDAVIRKIYSAVPRRIKQ